MSTKVKSSKSVKAVKATKAKAEKTGNIKSAAVAKAEAKARKKLESYAKHSPGLLIDRHGDDCGYVLYSPYFHETTILSLNDDAPRLITLETWERWGKQAKAFEKAAKSVLKVKKVVKKKKAVKKK
jgi:hypothetical protein